MLACSEEENVADLNYEAGEIIGIDPTFWVCGGGWYIATATDTTAVHDLGNQEIKDLLESSTRNGAWIEPIKVWVVFENEPLSSCAINAPERIKDVHDLQLREE